MLEQKDNNNNTTNKNINPFEVAVKELLSAEMSYYEKLGITPNKKLLSRTPPSLGRNETCSCGSGKKYKKCCLHELDQILTLKRNLQKLIHEKRREQGN